jgi:hypothetical protein
MIIDLIAVKQNMLKDMYQSKNIVTSLGMNYEKIDVCERNYMLFWKKHKDDTEWMHCSRSRYAKVVNEDTSLHAYHSEAQTVVPIRRNIKIDKVAQGRET